jgi:hypothetical protein
LNKVREEKRRVNFVTTFVGMPFPIAGKLLHTRSAGIMEHARTEMREWWKIGMMPFKSLKPLKPFKSEGPRNRRSEDRMKQGRAIPDSRYWMLGAHQSQERFDMWEKEGSARGTEGMPLWKDGESKV